MATLDVHVPPKLVNMFVSPRNAYRWRVLRGGRGSGKSFTTAKMTAIWGAIESLRVLCTREYQNSIKQSFHAELKNAIESEEWLASQYDVGVDYLRHKTNGTEFVFAGLRTNISSIKSMAHIDLCIVEEAETVPTTSWQDLVPTIRADGSGFVVIYNPKRRDSWVSRMFDNGEPPPRACIVDINADDNPWLPEVLREQRDYDREALDPALYRHIWEGAYYEQSDANVFNGKYEVMSFEPLPSWDGPYHGLDWGFAQDPTAAIQCYINDGCLYIYKEASKIGLELDETAAYIKENIRDIDKYVIRADSARPESISYVSRNGLPLIEAVPKWSGSVDDGIAYIKSFKRIYIHPSCTETINEFMLYSYKIDRVSGDILPIVVDEYNHLIDALRYALNPMIQAKGGFFG